MYDELSHACRTIAATPGLRAAVFRGSGGAFVAGTDISEFAASFRAKTASPTNGGSRRG
jgi:enoyl-CoA hydratase/carnithine racemase